MYSLKVITICKLLLTAISTPKFLSSFVFKLLSHVELFVTPWTVACQAPLSMAFSRQEDWSE